jgi:hypothetical protein
VLFGFLALLNMVLQRDIMLLLSAHLTLVASLGVSRNEVQMKELTTEQWDISSALGKISSGLSERVAQAFHGQNLKQEGGASGYYVDTYENGRNFAEWNLCHIKVSSNLGGRGPDTDKPAELRFHDVTNANGVGSVDLVLKATSNYITRNTSINGVYHCFAIVNVASSEEGTDSVDLDFGFVKAGTNEPVTFSLQYFTIYDMDTHGKNGIEAVTLYNDVEDMFNEEDCQYTESGDLSSPDGLTFTATSKGTGDDNPTMPKLLTEDQRQKSITVSYADKKKWKATFSVKGGTGARNFMFAGEAPPVDDSTCRVSGDCVIWGDPHIITFDAHQKLATKYPDREEFFQIRNRKAEEVSVHEEGVYWLVKSKDVHIQGRYEKRPAHKWLGKKIEDRTVLAEMAIGGPFLKGKTLVFRPLVGNVTWNGKAILPRIGSRFANHLISAKYHADSEIVKDGKKGLGIDVKLPGDMKLIVNRFTRGLAVKISMCGREEQDGHCGNFNGNTNDDVQEVLMARVGHRIRNKHLLPWQEKPSKQSHSKKNVKVRKGHGSQTTEFLSRTSDAVHPESDYPQHP